MSSHVDAPASSVHHASSASMLADAAAAAAATHHHPNKAAFQPADPPAASALHLPGHTIFLADPQRLAVLSLNIDAATTITTLRATQPPQPVPSQLPFPQQPASPSANSLSPPSSNGYRHASTSKLHSSPQPPPSSFHHAGASAGASSHRSSRSRPLSHDFGQKARDALNEFGRLASRRTSAMERANGAETLARVADGLHAHGATHTRRASLQPSPLQQRTAASPSTQHDKSSTAQIHLTSDDAVVIRTRAARTFTLQPQRDPRFTSQLLPLRIDCRLSSTDASASSLPSPLEFVTEPDRSADGAGGASCGSTLDPARLLLKVRPPAEHSRQQWSQAASFLTASNASQYDTSEQHAIHLRFRLRLCGSTHAHTPTSPSFPRIDKATLAGSESSGLGQVLFLSSSSPEKLASAIESPQSYIATSELASLEGISRVELLPSRSAVSSAVARGARDCDFDWTWKSLARSSSSSGTKCCCAFVEIRPDGKAATLLAAMSFYIELPVPVAAHSSLLSTAKVSTASKGPMSRSDSLALIAALNLDHDLSPQSETMPLTLPSHGGPAASDVPSQQIAPLPLLIDRTELALDDLVNDSPIFRAAVLNLERRTASLKKASKTVLRAAQEARLRILRLIEAEDAMDAAFEPLASLAPETLGRLQEQFLRRARTRVTQHRREQASIIETCLERPLHQMVELCRVAQEGFKLFENESKTYYSQTQKWLANRSNTDAATFASSAEDAPSARADEKQKLRELRFQQARLDLYAMLQRLHGGRAEAHLAQCVLQLSQWLADLPTTLFGADWTGQEQKAGLSALEADLRVALDNHALQLDAVEAQSRRLGDKIRSLETALGKQTDTDADLVGAHRFEMEQEAPQVSSSSGAVASKARKFKSFLGAFAAGINNSPLNPSKATSPNPEAAEFHRQGELFAPNGSEPPRRRLSLKLKGESGHQVEASASSPSKSQAPSSWKYDVPATPRRGSELHDSSRLRNDEASDQLAAGWRASPNAVRTASDAGSCAAGGHEASEAKDVDRGLGIFAPASPTSARAAPASSTLAPSPIPGGERKKEGVLYTFSKPITGPAGADAPRGVNRSAHWRECWVVLSGSGQISEFADWKNAKALEPTNPLIDLRFATVREARGVDRRFAFEIVTRDSRRFFQAPDEDTMRDWMRAISKAIESLLNGTSSVRKLDRAVRASPFRHDAAQRAGTFEEDDEEPGAGEGNDFAVRRLLDRTGKAFSQSMTDLSTSAKAQGGERRESQKVGGHLATLSESHAESSARSSKRRSRHERGISNKTPISGYLGAAGLGLSAADAAALHDRDGTGISDDGSTSSISASGEHDTEFDRQIEAVVHRSYGSHDDGTTHSGLSHSSANGGIVDEMGQLTGTHPTPHNPSRGTASTLSSKARSAVSGSVASTATSTKMSRSAEVGAISRQPENRRCADCHESDPRWASWMLANEPCCIFICIGCSGVHRSLGVHISKVKSVDLDDWTEEQVQAAREWGNVRANKLWEHSKPSGLLPTPGDRKDFWRIKYVEQTWKRPPEARKEDEVVSTEDVDATPTRQSVLMSDAGGPQKRSQAHALGLRITPTSPVKLADGLGSPRPNGPRPLPNRRSVSMQSVPTSSPPQSPLGPQHLYSIDASLRSPTSPTKREQRDWTVHQTYRRSEDDSQAAIPRISADAASVPHVSQAMLAARADARLFPPPASDTEPPAGAVSSPPSSYFVSNLDGPSPSPIFFEGAQRAADQQGWESSSESGHTEERQDPETHPPARFEAFDTRD